jgi:hypothetical protein
MTLPNFIIIGQMKAGTSSLHAYLRQHPDVFMPDVKELRFFSEVISETGRLRIDDDYRRTRISAGMPVTFNEYERLFDAATGQKALGEATPGYLNRERAAHQIKKFIPNVRLIVSLRRPSDRVYSHFQMDKRAGRTKVNFADAFRDGLDESWVRYNSSFEGLSRYYELFDQSQIKAIRFEDLITQSAAEVQRIFQFLEVDPNFKPDTSAVHNEGGDYRSSMLARVSSTFQRNWFLMKHVKSAVPAPIWNLGRALTRRNMKKPEPLTTELRREIASHFREDTLKVQELVGLDLSDWLER